MPKGLKGFQKGAVPFNKGKKLSIRHRKHLSDSHKGQKGRIFSNEDKIKMSNKLKGRKVTWGDKISKSSKGRKLSKETKLKMSIERRERYKNGFNPVKGKHWFSVTDRTKLKKSENKMENTQYIYWAKQVKVRDVWKCRLLSSECKGRLESHHIFNWVDYPELRYVINNGITLCHFHHPRGREEEKRMIPILQELLSVLKELF